MLAPQKLPIPSCSRHDMAKLNSRPMSSDRKKGAAEGGGGPHLLLACCMTAIWLRETPGWEGRWGRLKANPQKHSPYRCPQTRVTEWGSRPSVCVCFVSKRPPFWPRDTFHGQKLLGYRPPPPSRNTRLHTIRTRLCPLNAHLGSGARRLTGWTEGTLLRTYLEPIRQGTPKLKGKDREITARIDRAPGPRRPPMNRQHHGDDIMLASYQGF